MLVTCYIYQQGGFMKLAQVVGAIVLLTFGGSLFIGNLQKNLNQTDYQA
jgi:hypothetical protein